MPSLGTSAVGDAVAGLGGGAARGLGAMVGRRPAAADVVADGAGAALLELDASAISEGAAEDDATDVSAVFEVAGEGATSRWPELVSLRRAKRPMASAAPSAADPATNTHLGTPDRDGCDTIGADVTARASVPGGSDITPEAAVIGAAMAAPSWADAGSASLNAASSSCADENRRAGSRARARTKNASILGPRAGTNVLGGGIGSVHTRTMTSPAEAPSNKRCWVSARYKITPSDQRSVR
jgi:hypothetical protein